MRKSTPTILVAILLFTTVGYTFANNPLGFFLASPDILMGAPIESLLFFIVEHLPYGSSWGTYSTGSWFGFTFTNFPGWLVASLIVLAPVAALNYLSVYLFARWKRTKEHEVQPPQV